MKQNKMYKGLIKLKLACKVPNMLETWTPLAEHYRPCYSRAHSPKTAYTNPRSPKIKSDIALFPTYFLPFHTSGTRGHLGARRQLDASQTLALEASVISPTELASLAPPSQWLEPRWPLGEYGLGSAVKGGEGEGDGGGEGKEEKEGGEK